MASFLLEYFSVRELVTPTIDTAAFKVIVSVGSAMMGFLLTRFLGKKQHGIEIFEMALLMPLLSLTGIVAIEFYVGKSGCITSVAYGSVGIVLLVIDRLFKA